MVSYSAGNSLLEGARPKRDDGGRDVGRAREPTVIARGRQPRVAEHARVQRVGRRDRAREHARRAGPRGAGRGGRGARAGEKVRARDEQRCERGSEEREAAQRES